MCVVAQKRQIRAPWSASFSDRPIPAQAGLTVGCTDQPVRGSATAALAPITAGEIFRRNAGDADCGWRQARHAGAVRSSSQPILPLAVPVRRQRGLAERSSWATCFWTCGSEEIASRRASWRLHASRRFRLADVGRMRSHPRRRCLSGAAPLALDLRSGAARGRLQQSPANQNAGAGGQGSPGQTSTGQSSNSMQKRPAN